MELIKQKGKSEIFKGSKEHAAPWEVINTKIITIYCHNDHHHNQCQPHNNLIAVETINNPQEGVGGVKEGRMNQLMNEHTILH